MAVPIKYWGDDQWVKLLGMHMVFICRIHNDVYLVKGLRLGSIEFIIILICSILPFGTFYVDKNF